MILEKWGPARLSGQTNCPPTQFVETIDFSVNPVYLNQEFLYQKYVVEGLSAEEIGREIVSATSTVHKYLKHFRIPIRKSGSNIRPKRHLAYGKKIVGRRVEECKSELAVIEKMKKLREQGFSYWKVADILNSMGVPTKTRKGNWHARSVQQILDAQTSQLEVIAVG